MTTAIILHDDAVRRRARAAKRAAIQSARAGKPMPATREQHRALLGMRTGAAHSDPYTRRDGWLAVTYACASCGSLLVQARSGGPLPCGWCTVERERDDEARAEERLASSRPARLDALDTSHAPVVMRPWAWAAILMIIVIAGLAWADASYREDQRTATRGGLS